MEINYIIKSDILRTTGIFRPSDEIVAMIVLAFKEMIKIGIV